MIYDDLMARHWDYWDDGSYLHLFVAEMDDGRMAGGMDIMAGRAVGRAAGVLFRRVGDRVEPRGHVSLAYTRKKLTGTQYALSTDSDIYLYDRSLRADDRQYHGRDAGLRQVSRLSRRRLHGGLYEHGARRATSRTKTGCSSPSLADGRASGI
ncbi:MAG: hypothetical protein ACLR8Y_06290 [Alistipes indistinctus]